ncbi:MAG: hypothetical protein HC890_18030, partial [Chloroflexaceae bacterium]|nr:hypothetical protein [Chloroflexaceae bacterium]
GPTPGRWVNKIVLVSHLQQFVFEQSLAPLVNGVDIFLAGGSDFILFDETDQPFGSDEAGGPYPTLATNADGDPALLLSTNGEYTYVGRLVVDFDENGVLIPESVDPIISGAYRTTDQGVIDVLGADNPAIASIGTISDPANTVGEIDYVLDSVPGQVENLVESVEAVVESQDSIITGFTDVFLDGIRSNVRTEETNLGNLSSDANLFYAQLFDPSVSVSIQNAGGIRIQIGDLVNVVNDDGTSESFFLPPQANAFRPEGAVSELLIRDVFRFDNGLALQTITLQDLIEQLENGVEVAGLVAEPGQFPQVSGVNFSFDPSLDPGSRIVNAALVDGEGNVTQPLVIDGEFVADPNASIRVAINTFLAGLLAPGIQTPDGYTFEGLAAENPEFADVVDLSQLPRPELVEELLPQLSPTGLTENGQVISVATFLALNNPTPETAFDQAETPVFADGRIQNLGAIDPATGLPRLDSVFAEVSELVFGSPENDELDSEIDPSFDGFGDLIFTGAGADLVDVSQGVGSNRVYGGSGVDELFGGNNDRLFGTLGTDLLDSSEGSGSNRLYGGADVDEIIVGSNDRAFGGLGNDIIDATLSTGGSRLYGGAGDDSFFLGAGDRIIAGAGDDQIFAGVGGENVITGGAGADEFWIANAETPLLPNTITDFEDGADVIGVGGLGASFGSLTLTAADGNTTIALAGNDLAVLLGVEPGVLSEADFVFA